MAGQVSIYASDGQLECRVIHLVQVFFCGGCGCGGGGGGDDVPTKG